MFCPLHVTAFVKIYMLASNLDPTQCSSSHPLMLSITAMARENSAFVWIALFKSSMSSTKNCQNCLKTYSLVNLALSLNSAFGHILAVFSSIRILYSSHSAVLIGGSLFVCPPITGPTSKCQNTIRLTELEPQRLLCHRGSTHRRRPRGKHSHQRQRFTKAHKVEILCC